MTTNPWGALEAKCATCTLCPLHETRTQPVFGGGNPSAKILFIGEAPGEQEDLSGQPFVGRSGQLLDHMLSQVGLTREEHIYIANTVKCRPPSNRDPSKAEQTACLPYLKEQIQLLDPKIIVCLGRISAQKFIRPNFKISQEHGQWTWQDGRFITALYHPAALLRDPRRKPDTLADLQEIKRKIMEEFPCHS